MPFVTPISTYCFFSTVLQNVTFFKLLPGDFSVCTKLCTQHLRTLLAKTFMLLKTQSLAYLDIGLSE